MVDGVIARNSIAGETGIKSFCFPLILQQVTSLLPSFDANIIVGPGKDAACGILAERALRLSSPLNKCSARAVYFLPELDCLEAVHNYALTDLTKGIATTFAAKLPIGVSTVTDVPRLECSIPIMPYPMFFSSRGE